MEKNSNLVLIEFLLPVKIFQQFAGKKQINVSTAASFVDELAFNHPFEGQGYYDL